MLYTLSKEKFREGARYTLITMVRSGASLRAADGATALLHACPSPHRTRVRLCPAQIIDYLQLAVFFISNK